MTHPEPSDYAPFYAGYVARVPEENVLSALEEQSSLTQKLFASLDESRASYRYAPEKWSVKEIMGHLADAERVFGYRALAIGRGESQSLPGYDEDAYVKSAHFDDWKVGDLAEQYALLRRANIVFFRNLPDEGWNRRGLANKSEITVRAIAYSIVGHERHHLAVLRERYRIG